MRVAVIDGQGGGIGKHITERLRKISPEGLDLLALGTNALATSVMLRAGANEGASGEHAIVYNASKVDVIVGPVSIMFTYGMLGELTPKMAEAISHSPAKKMLIPLSRSGVEIIGVKPEPLPHLIDELVDNLKYMMDNL